MLQIDKNLKSFVSSRPMEQAFHYLSCLLTEKIWTYDEILRASTYVTINEIQKFKRIFIRKMHVECLIYGDMSKEEALSIIRKLEIDIIAANNNEIPTISMEEEMIPQREIKLEESK
ncbi:insulin-degrading enzyme-like [Pogonomyrmex barbatus]|uniref:Insulin-degrading enzyme-like n=1 Tax=Pogonomyrmex barbatus TaxID=144034 RepID=A0A8N1S873_9HYME|nr:insulin-degrading enzyme-like [Pogonomyrmex barbatus]